MAEIFNCGFEDGVAGGTNEFDSWVDASGDLDINPTAAAADTGFGLEVAIDDVVEDYGIKALTVADEGTFRFRYYFKLNDLADKVPANGRRVWTTLFRTSASGNTAGAGFYYTTANGWTVFGWRSNGYIYGTTTLSGSDWHYFEMVCPLVASSTFEIFLDGVSQGTSAPGADPGDVGEVFFGTPFGLNSDVYTSTTGVYLDELVVRDDSTEIGPYTGQPEGMITHEGGTSGEYDTLTPASWVDMSVHADGALATTGYGLKCVIDDFTYEYGAKDIALPVDSVYRYRAYIDINSLTMATNDHFYIGGAYSAAGTESLIGIEYDGADYLPTLYRRGEALAVGTAITDGPHYFEVVVDMAGGTSELFVDGVTKASITGAGNNTAIIDMRWGDVVGRDSGTSGTFFIDEIAWRPYNVEIGAWTANILDVDFETGATTEKGGVETIGTAGAIAVNPTAALNSSNFGLELTPGTTTTEVTYTLPGTAKTAIRARFYIDFNDWANTDDDLTLGPIQLLNGSTVVCALRTISTVGTPLLRGYYDTNSGYVEMTTETGIGASSAWVELEYIYSDTVGAFRWWLDGVLQEEDTGLATLTSVSAVTKVKLGWASMAAGGAGSAYIDDLIVRNSSTPIGTDGAGAGIVASSSGAPQIWRFSR